MILRLTFVVKSILAFIFSISNFNVFENRAYPYTESFNILGRYFAHQNKKTIQIDMCPKRCFISSRYFSFLLNGFHLKNSLSSQVICNSCEEVNTLFQRFSTFYTLAYT